MQRPMPPGFVPLAVFAAGEVIVFNAKNAGDKIASGTWFSRETRIRIDGKDRQRHHGQESE
jgi:hypothetical protein